MCARTFECVPAAKVLHRFGDDAAQCARIRGDAALRAAAAPGAPAKLPKLAACEVRLRTLPCDDFRDVVLGNDLTAAPECLTDEGTLEVGQGCAYSLQCKTGICASLEGTCGKCAPLAQLGEDCSPEWLSCDPTKSLACGRAGKCEKVPRRGESCGASIDECFGWSYCDHTRSTCKPWILDRGAACDPSINACDLFGGALVCNNVSNTCEPFEIAASGEVCGLGISGGGLAACDKGLLCDQRKPTTSNPFSGRCISGHAGRISEPCAQIGDSMSGDPCEENLACVGGVCTAIDATSCK